MPHRGLEVDPPFHLEQPFNLTYGVLVENTAPQLRGDAERNRQLLVRTAFELMAREGVDVSYKEIARAAGMGMGTIYRRFPERDDLLDAVFGEHIATVTRLAHASAAEPDAWLGLTTFLERQLEMEVDNLGLGELLRGRAQPAVLVRHGSEQMTPLVADMIARAVEAGQLPPGVTPADFSAVHLMIGALMDATRHSYPDLWRRALTIALAGLRNAELTGPPPGVDVINHFFTTDRKGRP